MKILELRTENVKGIVAIEIHPGEDPVVVISGENGAGKSSALDSIVMAMGGKHCDPPEVIRRGEKSATVEIDLGDKVVDYTVKCHWTPNSRKLSVKAKDGATYPSPQDFVEKLYGSLAFDPVAFQRLKPKEQMDTVRKLVGVDTSAIDAAHKLAYEARTKIRSEGVAMKARFDAMPVPGLDVPDEPVSVSALLDEQAKLQAVKAENDKARANVATHEMRVARAKDAAEAADTLCARLEAELEIERAKADVADEHLKICIEEFDVVKGQIRELFDPDLTVIYKKIAGAEATNAAVAAMKARAKLHVELEAKRAEAIAEDEKVKGLETKRATLISSAKFPVAGMSFGAEGLTLNDFPLEQASTADQLRVGMAMGLALNPKLRVVLIREGSLLSNKSMALVAEMAAAANAQVWIERVSVPTGPVGFEIVEGYVVSRDGVPVPRLEVNGSEVTMTGELPVKPGLSLVPPLEQKVAAEPDKKSKGPTFKKRPMTDLTGEELASALAEVDASIAATPLAPKSTAARAKREELQAEMNRRLDSAIDGEVKAEPREPGSDG